VRVEILRDQARAIVGCGSCGLKEEFPIKAAQVEIDIYCMFTDKIYGASRRPHAPAIEGA
jgi:transcription elongation factor Elf1